MIKHNDWERGLAIGVLLGSCLGLPLGLLSLGLVLTYDVYGERIKFLISRGLDKYFQLPSGVSEKLLNNMINPEEESEETHTTGVSPATSAPDTTPTRIRPKITPRPRLIRALGSLIPSGE